MPNKHPDLQNHKPNRKKEIGTIVAALAILGFIAAMVQLLDQ